MKKIIFLFAILFSMASQAQMKEGRVVYQRVIQLPTRLPNIDPEIAAQLPKSRTDQYELLFSNRQSLWQFLPSINGDENASFNGGGVMLRFGGGANDVTYSDFDNNSRVDHREVLDNDYLVSDTITKLSWKLSEETKQILNHTAHKATSTRISVRTRMTMENGEMKRTEFPDTATVVAWFTTDIPVAAGPDFQGQLPGLILELNVDNGQTVYTATEISAKVNASKIKEPKDGKKMTAAEFKVEREKLMKEMQKNMPNGMRVIQQ